jgi:N-acetylmuramoyl-L-alanine amidase
MSGHPDIKLAVLRGVYEDNLGIPRSTVGTGRSRTAPPPAPPPSTPLPPPSKRSAHPGKRILAALIGLAALLSIDFRLVTVDSSGPVAMQVTGEQATHALVVDTIIGSSPATDPARAVEPPAGIDTSQGFETTAGSAERYEAMLDQLGLPMAELFDLKVQTIVIDPGHGGIDPGATGHQGLREKDVALDIARRLRDKLTASGNYRVLLTREDDRKVYLKERVAFAKENRADLYVSVHVNSLSAASVNYVETYYFGPHTDQQSLDMAAKENLDSDYVMGDFRKLIARIGDTMKSEESWSLASSIHKHLYAGLKRVNAGLVDAGAKTGPFMVLLGVEVPSVLVEVSCISNKAEEIRLGTGGYRDNVAGLLRTGIVEYLERRANQKTMARGKTQHVVKQER